MKAPISRTSITITLNGICSRGHGATGSSSGSSTPFITSGSATPVEALFEDNKTVDSNGSISEKLRRESFAKAVIAKPAKTRSEVDTGLSKEHSEKGQVKKQVYAEYIRAASKTGFVLFLLAIVGQQGVNVLANFALRNWGEHNRETGRNSDVFKYLLIYGVLSLSSTLLGGASSIIMWVLCSLRSARRLHDQVRSMLLRFGATWMLTLVLLLDAGFSHARPSEFLRAHSHWTVSFIQTIASLEPSDRSMLVF